MRMMSLLVKEDHELTVDGTDGIKVISHTSPIHTEDSSDFQLHFNLSFFFSVKMILQ